MSGSKEISRAKLALKYEKLWHKLYYELARWEQQAIVAEPFGRHASDLARMVVEKAEEGE